jgi:hypothetical protein
VLPRLRGAGCGQGRAEDNPPRNGGDQRKFRLDEDGHGAALGGALQAVPCGCGRPSQDPLGASAQVEDDRRVVAVADQDVGGSKGLAGRVTPHPDQVAQRVGRDCARRKAVGAVDERDPLPRGLGGGEQRRDDGLAAAAWDGRDEFRQAPRGEAAAKGVIQGADARGNPTGLPAGLFREARGQKRPQRGDSLGGS